MITVKMSFTHFHNSKLYAPVVTLSIKDDIKFLENVKHRFERTISWKECRSEITTQPKNYNLDYLTDHSQMLIMILREIFYKYCMPLVKIKDFHVLTDNKPFLDQSVKSKQEA